MQLLLGDSLEQSDVVANNRMNRERNAVGVNSYERDIWLSPVQFLKAVAAHKNTVRWLDICCGRGKALIQTAQSLHTQTQFPEHQFSFVGIDLVDMFDALPDDYEFVSLRTESFFNFHTDYTFDLITCVHGLHYLGDKLMAIQKACSLLTPEGLFVANLDVHNIKVHYVVIFIRTSQSGFATTRYRITADDIYSP